MRDVVPASTEHSEFRVRVGDDSHWAEPAFDDSDWAAIDRYDTAPVEGIYWLRTRVRSPEAGGLFPSVVFILSLSPYEIFWDGTLVHRSGLPHADPSREKPGAYRVAFTLPAQSIGPGEHVVALRVSAHHSGAPYRAVMPVFYTIPPRGYEAFESKAWLLPALAVGAMGILALTGLVIWLLAARRLTLLLFAVFCLLTAVMVALGSGRYLWAMPSTWSYSLWMVQTVVTALGAGCLVAFVLAQFQIPRGRWVLAALGAADLIAAAVRFPWIQGLVHDDYWRLGFATTLGCCAWALGQRRPGAWLAITGVGVTALLREGATEHFARFYFLPVFLPAYLALLGVIGLGLRAERRQAQEAQLRAGRLEIELLRKNLQPHYLLNTLMTLAQAIEEKPAVAARFVDDVALVFRMLTRIGGERQVPLSVELTLCRAHLRAMSIRTGVGWNLVADDINAGALVPPALFLTLVENGFSHQRPDGENHTFVLTETKLTDGVRYRFFSPGRINPASVHADSGTGMRYIRSRLEEGRPAGWKLAQAEVPGGWETVIELHETRSNEAAP